MNLKNFNNKYLKTTYLKSTNYYMIIYIIPFFISCFVYVI